jgi:hypothetical protein
MSDTEDLTRLTVNLTGAARAALVNAHALTEDTRTDIVNRALIVYWHIAQQAQDPRWSLSVEIFGDGRVYDIEVKRGR